MSHLPAVQQALRKSMEEINGALMKKGLDTASLQGKMLNSLYNLDDATFSKIKREVNSFDPFQIQSFLNHFGLSPHETEHFVSNWNTQLVTHFISKVLTKNKDFKYPKLFEGLKEAPVNKQRIVLHSLGIEMEELLRVANIYNRLSQPPFRKPNSSMERLMALARRQRVIAKKISEMISLQYERGKRQGILQKRAHLLRPMNVNRSNRKRMGNKPK